MKTASSKYEKHFNTVVLAFLAFATYSCMYAFRKPFTVATFEDMLFLGIHYKIWLITAQVIGYTSSKFVGIKIIAEVRHHQRWYYILGLIGVAWLALLGFALSPSPFNIIFLFINGFPLGLIWGLVFTYVEGRQTTEVLMAALCTSFIFASGLVKSVGKWWLVYTDISEFWMPFMTGLTFIPLLVLSVWLLDRRPGPDKIDMAMRTARPPVDAAQRKFIIKSYLPGLILLIVTYMLLTAFRDFRDNFMAEIWMDLGKASDPSIFTKTEVPIAIVVLVIMSLIVVIRSNKKAFMFIQALVIVGLFTTGLCTLLFMDGKINAFNWMVLTGMGLYMSYIPFNGILFDRLVAAFRHVGTAGFLVYLADAFGYLGSTGVLLYKNFGQAQLSWLEFFSYGAIILSGLGLLLMISSMLYFKQKIRKLNAETPLAQTT